MSREDKDADAAAQPVRQKGVGSSTADGDGRRKKVAEELPGFCPIAATLHLMHEKWTLHIVYVLLSGKKRFNEIGHSMGGVNARTLRERLRGLEAEGIVERRVLSEMPPWVEYELTEKGLALSEVMEAMSRWSRRWQQSAPPLTLAEAGYGDNFGSVQSAAVHRPAMLCQGDDGDSDTERRDR